MVELFANSGNPDQTPHSVASDLGLHYLQITLLRVSRLQRVKLPALMPELFKMYDSGNSAVDISEIVYFGWLL